MGRDTRSLHGSWPGDPLTGSVIPPIYVSAVYRFTDVQMLSPRGRPFKYSREDNPTTYVFERQMALLEGGVDALAFSSGMAAIATMFLANTGRDTRIVAPRELYGSTRVLLERLAGLVGFELVFAGPPWDELLDEAEKADIVFVESMTNPLLHIPPIDELGKICVERGAVLVVDNTFATPVLLRPLELGADMVIHSATKYLAGHNDVVAGVLVSRHVLSREWDWRRLLGSNLPPFEAYLALRGLKTLGLRVERQSRTAEKIARFLEDHPEVERVYYPGLESHPDHENAKRLLGGFFGGVLSFEVKGGIRRALDVLRKLRIIQAAPSLGGTETLITHPATNSHRDLSPEERESLGITQGLLRLSVGLEDVEDLINDLDEALRKTG